jgi:hypothetical protein
MPKPKPPPASSDVVQAAFDDALQTGDINKLMACTHPGNARLVGLATIRSAFEAMCAHPVSAGGSHEAQDAAAVAHIFH